MTDPEYYQEYWCYTCFYYHSKEDSLTECSLDLDDKSTLIPLNEVEIEREEND